MSIYAYGIFLSCENQLDLPEGIKSKVDLVTYDNITVIIEKNISIAELQRQEETILRAIVSHDRVIQHIFNQVSLLPLRFGTGFVSCDSLINNLQNNKHQYLEKLNHIQNKVEYLIKFIPLSFQPDNQNYKPLKGKDYFLAKKQNYQLQQNFLAEQQKQWKEVKEKISQGLLNDLVIVENSETNKVFLLQDKDADIYNLTNIWQKIVSYWQITISKPLPCYCVISNK